MHLDDPIRERAYELFRADVHRTSDRALDDWLAAEREVRAKGNRMYVLDTSALIAIGRSKLEERLPTHDVRLSPVSFYEILCHLEEHANVKGFDRAKGILLKCRNIPLLHDPLAYHALLVGAERLTNATRFEERDVVPKLLGLLEASGTLQELYAKSFTYADGSVARLKDCSGRASRALEEMERDYREHVMKLTQEIKAEYPDAESRELQPSELSAIVLASLRALLTSYVDKDGLSESGLATKVVSSAYVHLAYKAVRACRSLLSSSSVDGNDFEDAELLFYIDPLRGDTLVTNDTGTLDAVNAARAAFQHAFGSAASFDARAVDCDSFLRETAPHDRD